MASNFTLIGVAAERRIEVEIFVFLRIFDTAQSSIEIGLIDVENIVCIT